jgi:exonuclease III
MASIIQWNIRGLRANYSELQLLISSHQPVALCLQELLIADSYQFQNKHYSLVTKLPDLDSHNRPTGGTSILIRKDIPHIVIPIDLPL